MHGRAVTGAGRNSSSRAALVRIDIRVHYNEERHPADRHKKSDWRHSSTSPPL